MRRWAFLMPKYTKRKPRRHKALRKRKKRISDIVKITIRKVGDYSTAHAELRKVYVILDENIKAILDQTN